MMTPKKHQFALEYLKDLNATQAAIRAGYSKKTAHSQGPRLLEDVDIRAEIDKANQKRANKADISAQWVLDSLKAVATRCLSDETFESSGANKSLELIGKHLKLFTDKTEHSGPNGGPIEIHQVNLAKLSDEDLKNLELILNKAAQPK